MKRMWPQGSLLTTEQASRGHGKKGLKEWREQENKRLQAKPIAWPLLGAERPKRGTEKQPKMVLKVLFHYPSLL